MIRLVAAVLVLAGCAAGGAPVEVARMALDTGRGEYPEFTGLA